MRRAPPLLPALVCGLLAALSCDAAEVSLRGQQTAQMSGCGGKAANCFRQRHLRRMCGIGAAETCAGSIDVRAGAVVKRSAGGEVRERGEWARCGCVFAAVRA